MEEIVESSVLRFPSCRFRIVEHARKKKKNMNRDENERKVKVMKNTK